MNNKIVNSTINVLGSYYNFHNLPDLISEKGNTFERTVSSKKRYFKAIQKTFLNIKSEDIKLLFMAAMKTSKLSEETKIRILGLQLYENDYLFQLLFYECFLPIMKSGRAVITKNDIYAYLNEQLHKGKIQAEWSIKTIDIVSAKFLTLLKKLGFLDGKVKKTVKEPFTRTEFLIFFHYWLMVQNEDSNTLTSSFFPFLLLSEDKYLFLMKQPEIREYINWKYTGDKFTVEPKLSLKEYIDELSN